MRRRRGAATPFVWTASLLVLVGQGLAACSQQAAEPSRLPVVRIVLGQGASRLIVKAEVAATEQSRAVGLMRRRSVPAGTGMLFVWPGLVQRPFYMKNTLVGLHVLFIRAGRVVEIRNMQPCSADPCPLTKPHERYESALEVPFGSLGILKAGATVEVFGRIPSPS